MIGVIVGGSSVTYLMNSLESSQSKPTAKIFDRYGTRRHTLITVGLYKDWDVRQRKVEIQENLPYWNKISLNSKETKKGGSEIKRQKETFVH